MKESYGEGPATHTGPESCVGVRKGDGETLTGGRAGRVFSRERHSLQSADAVRRSGRRYPTRRQRKTWRGSARSETPGKPGHTLREKRESPGASAADGAPGPGGPTSAAPPPLTAPGTTRSSLDQPNTLT